MNDIRTLMLQNILIADALASPLDTCSAEHIKNIYGFVTDFIDPSPAIKHKLHMWKKPASYTALSQYCILLACINTLSATYNHTNVLHVITSIGDSSKIFRHPLGFLQHLNSRYNAPTAELLVCIPTLFFLQNSNHIHSVISFILSHNKNEAVLAAALYLYFLTQIRLSNHTVSDTSILSHASTCMHDCIEQNSHLIFENGSNPSTVVQAAHDLTLLITKIPLDSSEDKLTEHCLKYVQNWTKHSFTRLTVNHPFTLLPYAMYIVLTHSEPDSIVFTALNKGGTISVLTPLTALLAVLWHGPTSIPSHLFNSLLNKKRLLELFDRLIKRSISYEYIIDFFKNEEKMTQKELEELQSKLKHVKVKPKQQPTYDTQRLSQHIVESWTKIDKARFKKQRKKFDNTK